MDATAYMDMDTIAGLNAFSIKYIERPLLKFKDNWIPPSPETLNKRIAHYADAYLNTPGGDVSMPIIWDAVQKGGNPNFKVKAENGKGIEPLIVKAARHGNFFLVQGLAAVGANINAKATDGTTALIAGAKAGSIEITSYLADRGADMTATSAEERTARQTAEDQGFASIAKYLKSAEDFNAAANSNRAATETKPEKAPSPAAKGSQPAA